MRRSAKWVGVCLGAVACGLLTAAVTAPFRRRRQRDRLQRIFGPVYGPGDATGG